MKTLNAHSLRTLLACTLVSAGFVLAPACKKEETSDDDDDDDDASDDDDDDDKSSDDDDDNSDSDTGNTDTGTDKAELQAEITALKTVPNPAPEVSGTGTFSTSSGKVKFEVTLDKCPEGMHGLHIHEGTECGDDGADAGMHWDPLKEMMHGEINTDKPHHAGDAGTVACDADGKGKFSVETDEWKLSEGDDLNPTGHAVILHGVDPAQRIACGVIEKDGDGAKLALKATTLSANPAPELKGTAAFSSSDDGVTLNVELTGCPTGMHGVHIHEGTACGDDGADAGMHWDPLKAGVHGEVNSDMPHHAGDAGMMECDADLKGSFSITTEEWKLVADDELNPDGHAFIVHGLDAKIRVGCGVIGPVKSIKR